MAPGSPSLDIWQCQSERCAQEMEERLLGNVPVPVSIALILDDEDEVKAREDGCLQLDVLPCRFQVIIPAPCRAFHHFRHTRRQIEWYSFELSRAQWAACSGSKA